MNIKTKTSSLMSKTMSLLIFFTLILLVTLYLFQTIFLSWYYENYKIREVTDIAKNLGDNQDNLNDYLNKVGTESDICIKRVTKEETTTYNEHIKGCILNSPNKYIKNLMGNMYDSDNDVIFYKITNPKYKSKTLLYGIRLEDDSYVYINAQLESLDQVTIVMRQQLIYILAIVIGLSLVIAYFISNSITKPIRDITEKAKKMSSDNYDVKFEPSNIEEINELSKTLNYAEGEMKKTDNYRRDLMANVSHDLKTPLTLIKSYAEMVRDISYKDDEKRNKHLNVIINETDRLNGLVNDILTLSKIEASKEELNISEYDLIKEIKEIIGKFEILEITENYHFILDGPEEAMVEADKSKINQVVYNLINNAINYTGDDATVRIKVTEVKNGYKVEIIDSGKGIDEETIKHIWDRYYKTEKNHRRNKVGTGLGLAIVKNILETHKFEYGVKSTIGKGTDFYFTAKKASIKKKNTKPKIDTKKEQK